MAQTGEGIRTEVRYGDGTLNYQCWAVVLGEGKPQLISSSVIKDVAEEFWQCVQRNRECSLPELKSKCQALRREFRAGRSRDPGVSAEPMPEVWRYLLHARRRRWSRQCMKALELNGHYGSAIQTRVTRWHLNKRSSR